MFGLMRMCTPFCPTYATDRLSWLENCRCTLMFHSLAEGFGYSRRKTWNAVPAGENRSGRAAGKPAEIGNAASYPAAPVLLDVTSDPLNGAFLAWGFELYVSYA